jgi:hypothetical protein
MDPFDDEGVFWLPDKDGEQQVAGRLKFDPAEGATLDLMGGFGDLMQQLNPGRGASRIHGVAGRRYLTLDGCFISNNRHEMPGGIRHTYYVPTVITGALFDEDESLTFDKCSVSFDQLAHWVGRTGITISLQSPEPELTSRVDGAKIEYKPPADETAQIDNDEELRLAYTWTIGGDNVTRSQLNQGTNLELKYPDARPLDDILNDVKYLQDLITLATTAPTAPLEITLWRTDITHEYRPGQHRPQAMKYYAGQISERVRLDKPQSAGRILFQFADIGGLPTIARWVKVAREYQAVVGALLSIRYASGLYAENRFNNVISAAESFHRLRFSNEVRSKAEFRKLRRELVAAVSKEHQGWLRDQIQFANEPRLRDRLREMVSYAGEAFSALGVEPDLWVAVVAQSRNRLTHHDKRRVIKFEPGDAYFLAESVFVLVMLCLLRECEVDAKTLANVRENPNMQFLCGRLVEIIPRLREQLKTK